MTVTWTPAAQYEDIRYELSGDGIAKITIDRPEVHNAFRPETVIELIDAFEKALALQPDHAAAHYALAVCYLKAPADVRRFYDRLGERRATIAPGTWFGDSAHVIRIGLAYPPDDELEKGLAVISEALRP